MQIDLTGKTAVICGSTQGIGFATAKQLAESGAKLILLARNEEKLKAVIEQLPNSTSHKYFAIDFSSDSFKQQINDYFKQIDEVHILVNNSGGPAPGPAHLAKTEEYITAFTQHLIANQILAQAVIDKMKKAKYGRIINVISTSVKQPLPNLGVSNTIRGAVANWAKTLASELAPFGITVNNVLPGATATGRLDSIISNKAKKLNITEEEAAAKMTSEIPAHRFAKPEELAYAICFLSSPLAAYINGINVPVDGGRTACL